MRARKRERKRKREKERERERKREKERKRERGREKQGEIERMGRRSGREKERKISLFFIPLISIFLKKRKKQMNYCEEETNAKTGKPAFACSISSCSLAASPNSEACKEVHGNANTVTRRYKLVATWGRAAPDGKEVDVVLINGLYPAPTISSNAGDRLIVEFVNQLGGPATSIHWHGVDQVRDFCFFLICFVLFFGSFFSLFLPSLLLF